MANPLETAQHEPETLLEICTALQVLGGVIFLLCSFSVSQTQNVGFNTILTALLYLAYPVASYWVVTRLRTPMAIGALMGGGLVICFLSFETAVYWGQLSLCEEVETTIRHYTCTQRAAYRITCFFSIIMFFLQVNNTFYNC